MSDEQFLKEVRERAERATEGPWVVDRPWLSRGMVHVDGVMPRTNLHPEAPYLVETVHNHGSRSAAKHVAVPEHGHSADDGSDAANNMEFIAHSRADIPKLLAMIEERDEKLRVAEDFIEDTQNFSQCSASRWKAKKALAKIRGTDGPV
jgi:hypothetical protein